MPYWIHQNGREWNWTANGSFQNVENWIQINSAHALQGRFVNWRELYEAFGRPTIGTYSPDGERITAIERAMPGRLYAYDAFQVDLAVEQQLANEIHTVEQQAREVPDSTVGDLAVRAMQEVNDRSISRMAEWLTSGAGIQTVSLQGRRSGLTIAQHRALENFWQRDRETRSPRPPDRCITCGRSEAAHTMSGYDNETGQEYSYMDSDGHRFERNYATPLTPEQRTSMLTPEASRRYQQRERARQNREGIVPDNAFMVKCELCGTDIPAQRSTKRYCTPCRSKAVVLNSVIQQLNKLALSNPYMLQQLMDSREQVSDITRQDFAPMLDGVMEIGVLGVINVALAADYGTIEWDGEQFSIHAYDSDHVDRQVAAAAPTRRRTRYADRGAVAEPEEPPIYAEPVLPVTTIEMSRRRSSVTRRSPGM